MRFAVGHAPGAALRAAYLLLGFVLGVAVIEIVPMVNDRPSRLCLDASDPLVLREPDEHQAPFSDWLPGPAALVKLTSDGLPAAPDGSIHPGSTATAGIRALNAGDRATAERMADGLMAHAVGYTFPYGFDVPGHGQKAPWVSPFAQGLALALFTRLGRPEAAAIATTLTPDASGWYEEYPGDSPVLDGHIFTALGLYEFGHVTGDAVATRKALEAIAVVRRDVHLFITSGGIWFDLAHTSRQGPMYTQTLLDQFTWLAAITGERCFDDVVRAIPWGRSP